MWPRLASAFEVDRLLKRTFLHTIPVWQLHDIVSTRMFHISDLCVALVEFFPRGVLNKEKVVRNDYLNIVTARSYTGFIHLFAFLQECVNRQEIITLFNHLSLDMVLQSANRLGVFLMQNK